MSESKIMLGNEAIARGAYEAGVKVSAAYPGTPSAGIAPTSFASSLSAGTRYGLITACGHTREHWLH